MPFHTSRPVARILGGVVLFQEKWTFFKIENNMNTACKACKFLGGLGACSPRKFFKIRCCEIEFGGNFSQ